MKSVRDRELIAELKRGIVAGKDPVKLMRGALAERSAIVVSAGPSASLFKEVYAAEIENNPIVVCVKQAVDVVDGLCMVHFLNRYNVQKYKYDSFRPLIISSTVDGAPASLCNHDIEFYVSRPQGTRFSETLAATGDYDDWILEHSGSLRPWGPGIMHELVFYSLLHMGVKRVVTVGWDIADPAGLNRHFYDNRNSLRPTFIQRVCRRFLREAMNNPVSGSACRFALHHAGYKYNDLRQHRKEAEVVAGSLPDFLRWLDSRGMKVEIVSQSEWMRVHAFDHILDVGRTPASAANAII